MSDKAPKAARGYRLWGLEDSKLLSLGAGKGAWKPGWNKAVCAIHEDHRAPVSDCECGFYAYRSIQAPRDEYSHLDSAGLVFGTVAGAGKLEVHSEGFRAEYLRIVALGTTDQKKKAILETLAQEWEVPFFDSEEELFDHSDKLGLVDLSEYLSKNSEAKDV